MNTCCSDAIFRASEAVFDEITSQEFGENYFLNLCSLVIKYLYLELQVCGEYKFKQRNEVYKVWMSHVVGKTIYQPTTC